VKRACDRKLYIYHDRITERAQGGRNEVLHFTNTWTTVDDCGQGLGWLQWVNSRAIGCLPRYGRIELDVYAEHD
jgi:hypothetical protein